LASSSAFNLASSFSVSRAWTRLSKENVGSPEVVLGIKCSATSAGDICFFQQLTDSAKQRLRFSFKIALGQPLERFTMERDKRGWGKKMKAIGEIWNFGINLWYQNLKFFNQKKDFWQIIEQRNRGMRQFTFLSKRLRNGRTERERGSIF